MCCSSPAAAASSSNVDAIIKFYLLVLLLNVVVLLNSAHAARPRGDIMVADSHCTNLYTLKTEDTCYTLSQKLNISMSDLKKLNPGINCEDLQAQQKVCLGLYNSGHHAPHGSSNNKKVFRQYIGFEPSGVRFTDVPIVRNDNLETHFILSFGIDVIQTEQQSFKSTNGKFSAYWNYTTLSPSAIQAIKAQHNSVKVMLSIGGDSVVNTTPQFVNFTPDSVSSWVQNAVASLGSLIKQYHLDGIDIDYEHFHSTPEIFASSIGQLITELKKSETITVASIAPFDDVNGYYTALWEKYSHVIDYVDFQFYTYDTNSKVEELVKYYEDAANLYKGGKVLASFSTDPDAFSTHDNGLGFTPKNMLAMYKQLQSKRDMPGMFVWASDTSAPSMFMFEMEAQALILASL